MFLVCESSDVAIKIFWPIYLCYNCCHYCYFLLFYKYLH